MTINRPPRDGHMAFVRSPDQISIELLQRGASAAAAGALGVDGQRGEVVVSIKTALTRGEARVIGCLIEKQVTTPDQYPLSLNALTNACNQKSNRDPVLDAGRSRGAAARRRLVRKHLVLERGGFGSRVPKYQHCFCNTEFSVAASSRRRNWRSCASCCCAGRRRRANCAAARRAWPPSPTARRSSSALEALAARAEGAIVSACRASRAGAKRATRSCSPGRRRRSQRHGAGAGKNPDRPRTVRPEAGLAAQVERLAEEVRVLRAEVAELRAQWQSGRSCGHGSRRRRAAR